MKKWFLTILFAVFLLFGCTDRSVDVRYEVAVSSDSVRIAYNVYGAGKTSLIFIHGWSCDSRYWKNQTNVFSKDYQVITIDIAGHGNSSLSRTNYTMLSFAEDIKAVIDNENINRAILVGALFYCSYKNIFTFHILLFIWFHCFINSFSYDILCYLCRNIGSLVV